MAFPKNSDVRVESVVFNGYKYNRYPDSPSSAHRRYFTRTGGHSLHRAIWEAAHGPIPKGWHVHHKDGDHLNNALENLECLPPSDHWNEHAASRKDYGQSEQQKQHLANIRQAAIAWHKSEEGRAWHRAHVQNSLAKTWAIPRPTKTYSHTCVECGAAFIANSAKAMYCGTACLSKRNNRVRNAANLAARTNYTCQQCGGVFVAAVSRQKFCSAPCKTKHNNDRKRAARVQHNSG